MARSLSNENPVSCYIIPKIIIHLFDGFWLVVILIGQETTINYYIIMKYQDSVYPYFFFALDFLCMCSFVGTLCVAYNHLKKSLLEDCVDGFNLRKRRALPSVMGESPLSYLSWLFYAIIFVTKIILIFNDESYLRSLSVENHFGPQLLKVAMASSSFLFLLLLEGHNWKKRGTPRYSYITSVCAKTGIEIFDSVSMLAVLMEGPEDLSKFVRDLILALTAINFLLPSVKLYQLSFPDFSKHNYSMPITVIHMILHMLLIDVPFLSVRLYLWLAYRENASMFLMKNILSIILSLRGMFPDIVEFTDDYLLPNRKKKRVDLTSIIPSTQETRVGFEEIALSEKVIKPENV